MRMRYSKEKLKRVGALAAAFACSFLALTVSAYAACDPKKGICNPLKWETLQEFIRQVLESVVMIALPFVVLAFVIVGFQFLFAPGEPDRTKAKKNFISAVIGALLIMGAWTLSTLIAGTVAQLIVGKS